MSMLSSNQLINVACRSPTTQLYEDLLPLLLGRPLEQALAETEALSDDSTSPFRTPPRAMTVRRLPLKV